MYPKQVYPGNTRISLRHESVGRCIKLRTHVFIVGTSYEVVGVLLKYSYEV